jgi:beta-lactamase regulating signal transducer with metallopeptidase domain
MLYWLPVDHTLVIQWANLIVQASFQGGLLFGLVWIIQRIFPKIHPTIRGWLWRIVYAKLFITLLGIKPFAIPWLTFHNYSGSSLVRLMNYNPIVQRIPFVESPFDPLMNVLLYSRIKFWCFLWFLGVLFFIGLLIFLWFRNRRACQNSYPVKQPVLQYLYTELCIQMKIRRPPQLLESDTLTSPLLEGLVHPKIILPVAIVREYPLEETRLMLAHELAHYRRGDLLWNWLPAIARILFFFHPLVWLAEYEWRMLQEICCDHLAVQYTRVRSVDYGKVLVKATVQSEGYPILGWAAMGAREYFTSKTKKTLFMRLKALGSMQRIQPTALLLTGLLLLLFSLVVLIPWQLPSTIFFSIHYDRLLNNITINGNIPNTENIHIRDFEVVIDNETITDRITWNSFGTCTVKKFEGYLLVQNSFNPQDEHQINVLVDTSIGDFQAKYRVDFSEKNLWANYSL